MSDPNPARCTVRGGMLTKVQPSKALNTVKAVCTAGAQSGAVQASALASGALVELTASVQTAEQRLADKTNLALALAAAIKALDAGMQDVRTKLHTYETTLDGIAAGSAEVITAAGLLARPLKAPAAGLEPVEKVFFRPGKMQAQAILSWPEAAGAGSYEVEVSFTPETMEAGPWTALTAASNQSRVVQAPTPRAQFLARVTSIGHDGTKSEPSEVVLVTAA
jgi:hypothetical protein